MFVFNFNYPKFNQAEALKNNIKTLKRYCKATLNMFFENKKC